MDVGPLDVGSLDQPTQILAPRPIPPVTAAPDRGQRALALLLGVVAGVLLLSGVPTAALLVLALGVITVFGGWSWLRGRWPR